MSTPNPEVGLRQTTAVLMVGVIAALVACTATSRGHYLAGFFACMLATALLGLAVYLLWETDDTAR